MKKKKSDFDGQRESISRIVNTRYTPIRSEKEKIALTIYNYGFWKGFAIALIIGLIVGGILG